MTTGLQLGGARAVYTYNAGGGPLAQTSVEAVLRCLWSVCAVLNEVLDTEYIRVSEIRPGRSLDVEGYSDHVTQGVLILSMPRFNSCRQRLCQPLETYNTLDGSHGFLQQYSTVNALRCCGVAFSQIHMMATPGGTPTTIELQDHPASQPVPASELNTLRHGEDHEEDPAGASQLPPADGGFAAYRMMCAAFVFEALLWGE